MQMFDMIAIVAGLVTVAGGIVALVGWGRRKARVRRQRTSPLSWKVVRPAPQAWDLVLDSDLPRGQISELSDASAEAVYEWVKRRGGVDWRETCFRLQVRCPGPRPVVIRDIRAEIIDTSPAIGETKVTSPIGGRGSSDSAGFDLGTGGGVALTGELDGALTIRSDRRWFDASLSGRR